MNKNVPNEDSLLINKAQNGDEGAFNFLMMKYYPRVYASLFSFTKSKEDSEDIAQQTFIKVWQQINSFRGESALFTWIYRIAINLAKNYVASSAYKKQKINSESTEKSDNKTIFKSSKLVLNMIINATKIANFSWVIVLLINI